MKNQQGFTLIELMIVVAIIAILAAIALPAYQDYVARSQVSEGMSLASGAKTAVAEYYANYADFAGANNSAVGVATAASIKGKYVSQVVIAAGKITATYGATGASAKILGGTMTLSPVDNQGSISWTCKGGGLVTSKYLPSSCR
ncbi:MAG: pilin [Paraburkholderia graminis]|uniref:pilin n=1 Tax=Paraburkholderia graminis TaxID=60548 RepID=UPI00389AF8C1